MANNQPQIMASQPAHHEQLHDAMEAAHQARAKAVKEGFLVLVQAIKHAFGALAYTRAPARPNSVS